MLSFDFARDFINPLETESFEAAFAADIACGPYARYDCPDQNETMCAILSRPSRWILVLILSAISAVYVT